MIGKKLYHIFIGHQRYIDDIRDTIFTISVEEYKIITDKIKYFDLNYLNGGFSNNWYFTSKITDRFFNGDTLCEKSNVIFSQEGFREYLEEQLMKVYRLNEFIEHEFGIREKSFILCDIFISENIYPYWVNILTQILKDFFKEIQVRVSRDIKMFNDILKIARR